MTARASTAPTGPEDIAQWLLGLRESGILDFKRVGQVQSALKTACAMANTSGGVIALGVEDASKATGSDRLFGIGEKPECLGEISRAMAHRVTPALQPPACDARVLKALCKLRDGTVGEMAFVHVPKSEVMHSLVDGGTYARFGAQNRQLSASEITELSLRRGVQSAVDIPVDVPVELLETQSWREYARQRKLTRPFEESLRHLGLVVRDPSGKWVPTVAAVLLFAEHPGGLLQRKCTIRILHYRGHEAEYDPDTNLAGPPVTVDGPLLRQIREATETVLAELGRGVQMSVRGIEFRQRYPSRVVQEAITNAVLHRDYRLSRDIHIRIFTNRIEVESPGVFPGAVTLENVRDIGSRPRNRGLVDHLREFPDPPNLDAGEGVRMMFATMEKDGFYPPIYDEETDPHRELVRVKLLNEARLSEWELVRDHLLRHGTVANAEVRTMLNLGANRVKASKLLRGWLDKGLIEVVNPAGGTRNRRYRLRVVGEVKSGKRWQRILLSQLTELSIRALPLMIPR